ncbi:hypothetical protein V1638_14980 [Pseudarthrobacter sp. J64]|uniref:hypothetical protein n=1 Tax=Pseudarthrobacter sp. J64 TaxID=3116485 RepID=UPI002E80DBE1|nr:hypothetical protein [Pseudarthrobacter sp. J64]MEE2570688.1 hypothetical protein [Pseudarthrobacter sp. J64]
MTSYGELLLQGPRGRRLCLELAMELDDDVRSAAFWWRFGNGKTVGSHTVLLSTSSSYGETASRPDAPSDEDVAGLLAAIHPTGFGVQAIQSALDRSVDAAMYWQEPDEGDRLTAIPVVSLALENIAQQLIRIPEIQWWWQPRGIEQWAIDWRSPGDPAPLPRNTQQKLAEWGRNTRAEEARSQIDRPADPTANIGGTWWSIPLGLVKTVGRVPAGLTLVEDSLGWEHATTIPVRGIGQTLEIRTAEDWIELCRQFPLDVTASRRHDWYRVSGRGEGRWVIPDWERVAGTWDAVHLTVMGYLNAAARALDLDDQTATVLAGWDPDSTIWLTDVAREWEGPRQHWTRESNRDRWALATQ